jgi:hypothetical protein
MGEAGFDVACESLYPNDNDYIFELIHDTFDVLPIAAVIQDKIVVIHGGIGDGSWSLKQLEEVYIYLYI